MELRQRALQALCTADPLLKVAQARELLGQSAGLGVAATGPAPPDSGLPGRPPRPELIHPFASAIDSKLPEAPQHAHILLDSKADWVPVDAKARDRKFDEYPDQSLEEWHRAHGLLKKA